MVRYLLVMKALSRITATKVIQKSAYGRGRINVLFIAAENSYSLKQLCRFWNPSQTI